MAETSRPVPGAFIWRRIHSLTGIWLMLFLVEHMATNAQAAFLFGGEAHGFIRMVNFLHGLPALHVIEVVLLGIPILLHGIWGVRYLLTGRFIRLPRFALNHGYKWMRITAVIVGVGIVAHVVQMRFINYPGSFQEGNTTYYYSTVTMDEKLPSVAEGLGVRLVQEKAISSDFAAVLLLSMREVFKNPLYVVLYSIFVLAACFHAGHGFWSFLITWGIVLKQGAQHKMYFVALGIALVLALLGLTAVWGT